jgi:hypothetical protein
MINWLGLGHEEEQIVTKYIGVTHPPLSDDPVLFLWQTHTDSSDDIPHSMWLYNKLRGANAQIKKGQIGKKLVNRFAKN